MNHTDSNRNSMLIADMTAILDIQSEVLKTMWAENDRLRELATRYIDEHLTPEASKNSKDLTASMAFNILKSHGLERPDEQFIPGPNTTGEMLETLPEKASYFEVQAHPLNGEFQITHRRFVFKDGSVIVQRYADNAYGLEGKERFTFNTPNPHEDVVRFG